MNIKELLRKNPDLCVIHAKIWTVHRHTIESRGSHDPVIGSLISLLLTRRIPSDREREAMQSLIELLKKPEDTTP